MALINKEKAMLAAKQYCEENGLSVDKLLSDHRSCRNDRMYLLRFPRTTEKGLYEDMDTQGVPILIVNPDYSVTETEYTREYLSK